MKRFLALSIIGAGLLGHSFSDATAQTSEVSKDTIWLSCPSKDRAEVNYVFHINFDQQRVIRYEDKWFTFYEMYKPKLSTDTIHFSYYTKGSHPLPPDQELLSLVDDGSLKNPLYAHVTTDIEINRRSLLMRSVKRYNDTIFSSCEAQCFVIDAVTLPSRQF
jgi:hypothetical protein